MTAKVDRLPPTTKPREWGFTDEELASLETVYRPGLLEGKVFVVSGGGSGIGRGITYLLSHPEQVQQLMEATFARFGRLDTVVNNGGGQFPQSAIDYSVKGWNAVIDTNLNGAWYMMQSAARMWRDRGEPGNIVNIVATIWRGMPQVAHTTAARAGVIYLSKTLATEWSPLGIRVNCVAPGAIETRGLNVYPEGAVDHFAYTNPMKRLGDVQDIAEAVVYMSSTSGKFITGETLVVDGGHMCWGDTEWPGGKPAYFRAGQ